MLKLKFDPKLDFQIDAINSVVDLFKGQPKKFFDYSSFVVPNVLDLPKERILENLKDIQKRNGLSVPNLETPRQTSSFTPLQEVNGEPYNFTIERKTGSGKNLCVFKNHFRIKSEVRMDKAHYTYFPYKSDNLVMVRMFGQATNLQIMVITKDAFNKDINIIHIVHDKMKDKPIEIIKKTNPKLKKLS